MNNELLRLRGIIAESERQKRVIDAKCKGGIFLIRNLLNPYEDDMRLIETEQVLEAAKSLDAQVKELAVLTEKINRMKADLR